MAEYPVAGYPDKQLSWYILEVLKDELTGPKNSAEINRGLAVVSSLEFLVFSPLEVHTSIYTLIYCLDIRMKRLSKQNPVSGK